MKYIVDLCIPFTELDEPTIIELFNEINTPIQSIRMVPTVSGRNSGYVVFLHINVDPTSAFKEMIATIQKQGHYTLKDVIVKLAHKQPSNLSIPSINPVINQNEERIKAQVRYLKEQRQFKLEMERIKNKK